MDYILPKFLYGMFCPCSLYSNGFEMKRKIILGLLSFLSGSAYAADIRMNNNNPLNTRRL